MTRLKEEEEGSSTPRGLVLQQRFETSSARLEEEEGSSTPRGLCYSSCLRLAQLDWRMRRDKLERNE